MDEQLRDLFQRPAPPAPSTRGWAKAARRKRRTRQTSLGAVVAVAIVGLAVPLAAHLSDGPRTATPEPARVSPSANHRAESALATITSGHAYAREDGVLVSTVELRSSLAVAIGATALAEATPGAGPSADGGHSIVLATASGVTVELHQAGDSYHFEDADGPMVWTPAPEFAAELDALFGG